jgi:hypothetical protein
MEREQKVQSYIFVNVRKRNRGIRDLGKHNQKRSDGSESVHLSIKDFFVLMNL